MGFDILDCLGPGLAKTNVEALVIQSHSSTKNAVEQNFARLVIVGFVSLHPAVLHQHGFEAKLGGNSGNLSGVVALNPANRQQGVTAELKCFGCEVFQLPGFISSARKPRIEVFAFGPNLYLPTKALGEAVPALQGGGAQSEGCAGEGFKFCARHRKESRALQRCAFPC